LCPFPPPLFLVGWGFVDLVNIFEEPTFCFTDSLNIYFLVSIFIILVLIFVIFFHLLVLGLTFS
jgi:hypothetical protein